VFNKEILTTHEVELRAEFKILGCISGEKNVEKFREIRKE